MAQINVENMEENAKMFEHKMGFAHDADGLDMSDEQLVNFLLMCQHGMDDEEYDDEEMYEDDEEMMEMPEDSGVKVKVMRLGGGNVHELMNEILGG